MRALCLLCFFFVVQCRSIDSQVASSTVPSEYCRCTPKDECWGRIDWDQLRSKLSDPKALELGGSRWNECKNNSWNGADCSSFLMGTNIEDPYQIQSYSWAHLTAGRLDEKGFEYSDSGQARVAVRSTDDVSAAVKFANDNNLKITIKSGGHDYLGRSQDPNSLLIWTHHMRDIMIGDKTICGQKYPKAFTVGAGARWQEVYNKISDTGSDRYVVGGAVGSVGVAGFTLGGGYSLMSRYYGPTAAYVREMEVVKPDGTIATLNACSPDPDDRALFKYLKGSGNGGFGVVTKFVFESVKAFNIGSVEFKLEAPDKESYKHLLSVWLDFYHKRINTRYYGNIIHVARAKPSTNTSDLQRGGSVFSTALFYTGLTKEQVNDSFQELKRSLNSKITMTYKSFDPFPISYFRSIKFRKQYIPGTITSELGSDLFYDKSSSPALYYIADFKSLWLKSSDFSNRTKLVETFLEASTHHRLEMQASKSMQHARPEAIDRFNLTSGHPAILDSPVWIVVSGGVGGVPRSHKEKEKLRVEKAQITKAYDILSNFTEGTNTYHNQSGYTVKNWTSSMFGEEYGSMSDLKWRLDPKGLFACHQCVGSERMTNSELCVRGL